MAHGPNHARCLFVFCVACGLGIKKNLFKALKRIKRIFYDIQKLDEIQMWVYK